MKISEGTKAKTGYKIGTEISEMTWVKETSFGNRISD